MSENWTNHDIVVYYKQAKNKIEQVEILAETTGTDVDTILQILKDEGVYKGKYYVCGRCGHQYPSIYKRPKNPFCPDCRDVGKAIADKEWKLKKNIARMASLAVESQRLREEIDGLREVK